MKKTKLQELVKAYRGYKSVQHQIKDSLQMIEQEKDEELKAMAREELAQLQKQVPEIEEHLKILLIPKDPNDDKNIILEIRAGAGGDEASLFCYELYRSYCLYANKRGWKVEGLSVSEGNVGGYKEVIAAISGEKVFSRLKYESGVHRVQRVPQTETQGRVHTSTITVAVLPEAEEVDVELDPNDVRVDVFRSSGAGGQSVNTTDSAVRLTHIPTGIVVSCQDEKSQIKNKSKAMKVLLARLQSQQAEKELQEASSARLAQIGTGDRSERIRTYNFPQSRCTDHRIGLTTHNLDAIMNGDIDGVIEPLITHYQTEALKAQRA
jgi:peptide chain release factor 1